VTTTAVRAPSPVSDGGLLAKARRRRRSLAGRVTWGHVLPVVLAVLAAVFAAVALGDRSSTVQVPVANGPIAAGAPVDRNDTHLVSVHAGDSSLRAGLLPAASLGEGWVAAVAINAGDPITRSEVAHAAAGGGGLGAMSIPVAVSHADGGAIVAGDRVDVIGGSAAAGPEYIAKGLKVLDVANTRATGVLATSTGDYFVVVAVDRATALKLSAALAASGGSAASAGIQVVRTTGEAD
jgi:Flp pilus assembly protein CpaB